MLLDAVLYLQCVKIWCVWERTRVGVRMGVTERYKVHFERLRARPEPCYHQHSTTPGLMTQAVRDRYVKLGKLFS